MLVPKFSLGAVVTWFLLFFWLFGWVVCVRMAYPRVYHMIQICLASKASGTSNLPNEFRNSHARYTENKNSRDAKLRRQWACSQETISQA
jgi:hypothetical protein